MLGTDLFRAGQTQQALQVFNEDLKKNPNNPCLPNLIIPLGSFLY